MSEHRVDIEDSDGVRLVAFDRPEARNAFDRAMYRAVTEALAGAAADDGIRAVVLTGRGSVFTAGQDLKEMVAIAAGDGGSDAGSGFRDLLGLLVDFDKPLLAAVHGVGMGLGFTILGHVDLILLDEEARLQAPFAELGVPPEAGSSWLLPERMGWQRAAAALLASEWVDADQAVASGLALRVCPAGTVLDETMALARRIASFPPHATQSIKRLMTAGRRADVAAAREREESAFAALFADPATNPGWRLTAGLDSLSTMRLGITAFLTDRAMAPARLARAAEERGFRSLYFPEHTHLPVRADTPPALVEGVHLDDYRRSLDPFVALSMAAAVTERLVLGTGVVLAAQHDPIVLAKQIATLDHLSDGRVVFGVGFGWNREEAADHGVPFGSRRQVAREHVLCMQALWSQEQAEFHGQFVSLDACWSWPKPVQQPRVTTLVGGGSTPAVFGAIAEYADGWMPVGGSGLAEALPRLHRSLTDVGRSPDEVQVVPFGTVPTDEKLAHYQGLGIRDVVLRVPSGTPEEMIAVLDGYAAFVGRFGTDDE